MEVIFTYFLCGLVYFLNDISAAAHRVRRR